MASGTSILEDPQASVCLRLSLIFFLNRLGSSNNASIHVRREEVDLHAWRPDDLLQKANERAATML